MSIISSIYSLGREPYTTPCVCCGARISLASMRDVVVPELLVDVQARCAACEGEGRWPRVAIVDRVLAAVGLRRVIRGIGLSSRAV